MEKFSNIKKSRRKRKSDEPIWSNNWLSVKEENKYTYIEERDSVVCIPILMERNEIILRVEDIPPFNIRDNRKEHLTVISGTIEDTERPVDTLRRELTEEAGLILRDNMPLTIIKELFVSKSSNKKFHLSILPLYETDYQETKAKGDGSIYEKNSRAVKVNINNINPLLPSDIITELLLNYVQDFLKT